MKHTLNVPTTGGRKVFRDFLRCEYSEENILFWLACEDLQNETDPNLIEEKCRVIYEDYISILSPKEVCLISVLSLQFIAFVVHVFPRMKSAFHLNDRFLSSID